MKIMLYACSKYYFNMEKRIMKDGNQNQDNIIINEYYSYCVRCFYFSRVKITEWTMKNIIKN